ncbi:uncharacterized protein LOC114255975 [Camellia sinensis]|uniref:uncharacterized protein LOC114255975 n=1 Tax=Camellia sinensis TaxID=4442 RepID=UPI001036B16E|nr:uncharacterized protein LOC114255975 [Camellia sinensis]
MADSKVYTPIGGRSGSGGRGGRGGRGQNPVALNPELGERERERVTEKMGGEGREGDWECGGCRNRNYAFRSFCNRCKQSHLLVDTRTPTDSKWLPRISDWICTGLAFPSLYFYNGGVREFLATIKQQVFIASLPWQGQRAATKKQKYDKICEKKLSTPIEVLRKSHPVDFASYFHYCHSLTFDQRPDYGFLKHLFHDLFTREGNDKIKDPFIKDYREHNDDTTVHFEVIMSDENLIMAKQEGLLKKFKLTTTISTSNMHLFDPKGVIKKYETPEQILEEFFHESEVICQT